MSSYDIVYLGQKAEELGFVRDTLEKVFRLSDILEYFNTNPILSTHLALKGGTAINLTIFNLPRLSVDIDLDYIVNESKEEMLRNRDLINTTIERYLLVQGYSKSDKSKKHHSLDSWIYTYILTSGNRDNIKIEINYSLRSHIFPARETAMIARCFSSVYKINALSPIEIYGSKINALLNRAAPRDLYDVANMINLKVFSEAEKELLKKTIIFYAAVSSRVINKTFDTKATDLITSRKIKTELLPVIKREEKFSLEFAKKIVKDYIRELMILSSEEKEFLDRFERDEYMPELLFDDAEILKRIIDHPMALWKTIEKQQISRNQNIDK